MAQVQSKRLITPQTDAEKILRLQQEAFEKNPMPSYDERIENLKKLKMLLLENQEEIAQAVSKDFGNRSIHETKLVEIFGSIEGINLAMKELKSWMKPQNRHTSIYFFGGKNKVIPQPKGVVGVITPWNYPIFLNIGPVTSALAAGNRCMVKMAAASKNLRELMARLFKEYFEEETLVLLPDVKASEFSSLPFDHLVFTGSAQTGKEIMKAAAQNLTPVTLELGGKSPTIIAKDYHTENALERILFAKYINAGQTCVAPDYLFIPNGRIEETIKHSKKILSQRYPNIMNEQYTSIIDDKAFERLEQTLEDAKAKGAVITPLTKELIIDKKTRKISPIMLTNVNDSMKVMQEEIFGPLFPVMTYDNYENVLDYIKDRQHPLGLYLFTKDKELEDLFINSTLSGGVTINDCAMHVLQDDIPFGGVGESGMGHYHAKEGFLELSKLRPVFKQPCFAFTKYLYPPYGKTFNRFYKFMTR